MPDHPGRVGPVLGEHAIVDVDDGSRSRESLTERGHDRRDPAAQCGPDQPFLLIDDPLHRPDLIGGQLVDDRSGDGNERRRCGHGQDREPECITCGAKTVGHAVEPGARVE
ncbi:hypothetical protein, partial [Rhodococcus sp. R1101]|uniref:hypothetical protein n=1 Tax=Rhodococcus sp. R1101 TaxID=1170698 RepID=UPI001E4DCFF4